MEQANIPQIIKYGNGGQGAVFKYNFWVETTILNTILLYFLKNRHCIYMNLLFFDLHHMQITCKSFLVRLTWFSNKH